jgi:hypothetical protein
MTAVQVKSFVIDNKDTADATIASSLNVTSVVFSISVVPISNTQSRVIIIYN